MNKKVLLSGCTGQDGSYMVDYLLENTNHDIYGIIRRLSVPNKKNIKHNLNNPRFKIITGDLSDSQSIDNLVREIKPDYFINFGAQSFVQASWEIPEQTFDIDAMGVLRCLEAIRKNKPDCRFYSSGSSEQWGNVVYSPQDFNHPMRPRSVYGAAKCAAGLLTKVYRESYNLFAVHCILTNHESERRGEEFVTRKITKGVARIYHAIKNNQNFEPIELGNLDAKRDWSHAKDFIRGIWMVLNQDKPKEYIFSSGENHSIREFIELAFSNAGLNGIWKESGIDEKFIIVMGGFFINGLPSEVSINKIGIKINKSFYRLADVESLQGDSILARLELDWKPEYSFKDLVSCMVKYDIENYNEKE